MTWYFSSQTDKEMMSAKAANMSLSAIRQIIGLFCHKYDAQEMELSAQFLEEIRERLNREIDKQVIEYRERGARKS